MSDQNSIKKQLINHARRLQKLKETKALHGSDVSPKILLEIEDIEAEIEQLRAELKEQEQIVEMASLTNSNDTSISPQKAGSAKSTTRGLSRSWWVLIIVALIGFGVVIALQDMKPESPAQSPPPQSFPYSVRVQAKETGQDISGVKVTIEIIGQAPLDEVTDSNGFARIFIDANRAGQPGRLIVEATGYRKYTQNIDLLKDALPDVIQLESTP